MRYLFIILGILLVFAILFSVYGCGVGVVGGINATLTTAEIVGEIAEKVDDLNDAGVPQKVADDVRSALAEANAIIDKHHKTHVRDQQ